MTIMYIPEQNSVGFGIHFPFKSQCETICISSVGVLFWQIKVMLASLE